MIRIKVVIQREGQERMRMCHLVTGGRNQHRQALTRTLHQILHAENMRIRNQGTNILIIPQKLPEDISLGLWENKYFNAMKKIGILG
jgi:hypothetical protein